MSVDPITDVRAITNLHKTIQKQIEAMNRQSRTMFWLTWAAVLLAVVQTGSSMIQVWFTF